MPATDSPFEAHVLSTDSSLQSMMPRMVTDKYVYIQCDTYIYMYICIPTFTYGENGDAPKLLFWHISEQETQ